MDADIADTLPSLTATLPPLQSTLRARSRVRIYPAFLTPARQKLAYQFLRFGVVGSLGFMWDAATVYSLKGLIGLTAAALLAYFVAASMNWLMNRLWTFRGTGSAGSALKQWGTFLVANSFGFMLNRGTVLILLATVPLCHNHPILALVCGTAAGMFSNFTMSRRLVFR